MKRLKYLIYFIVFSFILIGRVDAESCPLEQRTSLSALATNINITYEEVTEQKWDPENEANYDVYFLEVKIYNMTPELRIKVSNDTYSDVHDITYKNMDYDGVITLRAADLSDKVTYFFEIYGSDSDCYSKKMRTVKLTLPKYNHFSYYSVCDEIPEFYMCQRYVLNDFDTTTFHQSVAEYKERKSAQENEMLENGDVKENTSSVTKIAKKVSDNKLLVSGIVIGIGVIITIVILIKKKRSVL